MRWPPPRELPGGQNRRRHSRAAGWRVWAPKSSAGQRAGGGGAGASSATSGSGQTPRGK